MCFSKITVPGVHQVQYIIKKYPDIQYLVYQVYSCTWYSATTRYTNPVLIALVVKQFNVFLFPLK